MSYSFCYFRSHAILVPHWINKRRKKVIMMGPFNRHRPPTVLKLSLNRKRERLSKRPSQYIQQCARLKLQKKKYYHISAYHPQSSENFHSNMSSFRLDGKHLSSGFLRPLDIDLVSRIRAPSWQDQEIMWDYKEQEHCYQLVTFTLKNESLWRLPA